MPSVIPGLPRSWLSRMRPLSERAAECRTRLHGLIQPPDLRSHQLRLDGEPSLWHSRFCAYDQLGPTRSLERVYHDERVKAGKGGTDSLPGAWASSSTRWSGKARAEAHDAEVQGGRGTTTSRSA